MAIGAGRLHIRPCRRDDHAGRGGGGATRARPAARRGQCDSGGLRLQDHVRPCARVCSCCVGRIRCSAVSARSGPHLSRSGRSAQPALRTSACAQRRVFRRGVRTLCARGRKPCEPHVRPHSAQPAQRIGRLCAQACSRCRAHGFGVDMPSLWARRGVRAHRIAGWPCAAAGIAHARKRRRLARCTPRLARSCARR